MTYKVDVHLALHRKTEIECYPSVIAVLNWLFVRFEFSACEFSCCDYEASCHNYGQIESISSYFVSPAEVKQSGLIWSASSS